MAEPGKVTRTFEVTRAARSGHLLRVLREVGVVGRTEATREAAIQFRQALEELGATFVKLGQLLSSRPDLLPDVYIEELGKLVDDVPPVPFPEIREVVRAGFGDLVAYAERVSDLPAEEVARFFAMGMLLNVFASMEQFDEGAEPWAVRLLEACEK